MLVNSPSIVEGGLSSEALAICHFRQRSRSPRRDVQIEGFNKENGLLRCGEDDWDEFRASVTAFLQRQVSEVKEELEDVSDAEVDMPTSGEIRICAYVRT